MDGYHTMAENVGSKISCHYTYRPKGYSFKGILSLGCDENAPDFSVCSDKSIPLRSVSPETQLFSLVPDPFPLPDLVIKVNDKVFHELSFGLGSESGLCDFQDLSELIP